MTGEVYVAVELSFVLEALVRGISSPEARDSHTFVKTLHAS